MGVRGLLSYCSQHIGQVSHVVDLVQLAAARSAAGGRVELLVDFHAFAHFLCETVESLLSDIDPFVRVLGGEYNAVDYCLKNLVVSLAAAGITLVFFEDGPSGSDAEVFEEKFEEVQKRTLAFEEDVVKIGQLCNSYLGLEALDRRPLPTLMSRQIGSTAIRMTSVFGTRHVKCRGEAEVDMVKYLRDNPDTAYAVLGNDSDFAVLKDSRFIPYDYFDLSRVLIPRLMGPAITLSTLRVRVITPRAVQKSLKLSSHQDLIEVAVICGNDYTRNHWDNPDARSRVPCKGVKFASEWFRDRIGAGGVLENNADFAAHLDFVPKFKDAIQYSRRFYQLKLEDPVDHDDTKDAVSLIRSRVEAHQLPTHALAWIHGVTRRRLLVESHAVGDAAIEHDLSLFRKYLYALSLGPTSNTKAVRELGRTHDSGFDVTEVAVAQLPLPPLATDLRQLDFRIRLALFDVLLTSLEDDGVRLETLGFDPTNYPVAEGTHSFSRDFFLTADASSIGARNANEAFLAYLINYLLSLSLANSAKTSVSPLELLLVVDATLGMLRRSQAVDFDPYEEMRRESARKKDRKKRKPPDFRCLTLLSWCESLYAYAMDSCICLGLESILPQPSILFSGLLFERSYQRIIQGGSVAVDTVDANILHFYNGVVSQHPDPNASLYYLPTLPDGGSQPNLQGLNSQGCCPSKTEPLGEDSDSDDRYIGMPPVDQAELPLDHSFTSNERHGIALSKDLPILDHRDRLMTAVHAQRVTCIEGETGCGKSTQVPQFILDDWHRNPLLYSRRPKIIVTQPRRIAAKTLAERVARERGAALGGEVGYRIGQDYKSGQSTRLLFVTTGYMMKALTHHADEMLRGCTHLILDEVHERELENDLLSLIVKLVLKKVPDLKLIVMSATIQGDLFLRYFASESEIRKMNETVLFVGARRFPVDDYFLEDLPSAYAAAFDDDDCLAILRNACVFNKKPMAYYLELNDWRQASMPGSGFAELSSLARRLHPRNASSFQGTNTCKPPSCAVDSDELRFVFVRLLPFLVASEESILVFLPGRSAIDDMFDLVVNFEGSNPPPGWLCCLRVFVLHSMVPFEDQLDAFNAPPPGVAHLILATNVAESSITLPNVRVVVDFGQQRRPVYHPDRRMTMLDLHFCSQASCQQRRGRTGRVFPGICIKFFTREFYDQLAPFDPPQMQDAPLDNLVLQVKSLGRLIAPGSTPTSLLLQSVEPPRTENIQEAVRTLADIGAIEANDEMAELTLLGHIGMHLPIDLRYARLIVYAILFGVECDGVVFAAAIQSKDPFNQPTKKILKNDAQFISSLEMSTRSRNDFDDGLYSEHIMLRNLFVCWLLVVEEQHHKRRNQHPAGLHLKDLKRRFCGQNAVNEKRFNAFENLVADLAAYAEDMAPEGEPKRRLRKLMSLLPRDKRKKNPGGDVNGSLPEETMSELSVGHIFVPINFGFGRRGLGQKRFTSGDTEQDRVNAFKLYAVLTAALSPMFLVGEVNLRDENKVSGKKGPKNKMAELEKSLTASGFDARRSFALTDIADVKSAAAATMKQQEEQQQPQGDGKKGKKKKKKDESGLIEKKDLIKALMERLAKGVEKTSPSASDDDTIYVQFHDPAAAAASSTGSSSVPSGASSSTASSASPAPKHLLKDDASSPASGAAASRIPVLRDVSFAIHDVFKFSEGKTRFIMQIPPHIQQGVVGLPETAIQESSLEITSPKQPYRVNWRLLSAGGSSLENCRGHCSWRNPIGFACHQDCKQIFAIGSQYVASSARMGWLEGVTILPSENDNVVSLVLLLAFVVDQYDLQLIFDVANETLTAFRVFGHSFDFPAKQCLSVGLMEQINLVRSQVSGVFTTSSSPSSSADSTSGRNSMGVTIGRNNVGAALNGLLTAVLNLEPSDKLPFFKRMSENMYLGPPSTLFSSSSSSSPSGAPRRPQFQTLPAFGADFKRRDALKIGFFHAGITDVTGDDDDDEESDQQDFFMLRPFDLTAMTSLRKAAESATRIRLTDFRANVSAAAAASSSSSCYIPGAASTSAFGPSVGATKKSIAMAAAAVAAATAAASTSTSDPDVLVEMSGAEDEEEEIIDAARLVAVAPLDESEVLDRILTLLSSAPEATLPFADVTADAKIKKIVALIRQSGSFKWAEFHRRHTNSYSVCICDGEACLKLKSSAATSKAKAEKELVNRFIPSFVAMKITSKKEMTPTTPTTTTTTTASMTTAEMTTTKAKMVESEAAAATTTTTSICAGDAIARDLCLSATPSSSKTSFTLKNKNTVALREPSRVFKEAYSEKDDVGKIDDGGEIDDVVDGGGIADEVGGGGIDNGADKNGIGDETREGIIDYEVLEASFDQNVGESGIDCEDIKGENVDGVGGIDKVDDEGGGDGIDNGGIGRINDEGGGSVIAGGSRAAAEVDDRLDADVARTVEASKDEVTAESPSVSQLLGRARQGKRGRRKASITVSSASPPAKLSSSSPAAASSSPSPTTALSRSSTSRNGVAPLIDPAAHNSAQAESNEARSSPTASRVDRTQQQQQQRQQQFLPTLDKKFLVERLSRYLIFRVGLLSPCSSSSAFPSAQALIDALLHPKTNVASPSSTCSHSPPQPQTLTHFVGDPYVAKLSSLLSWSRRDLKRFLEASRIFKKKKEDWVLTKYGAELFSKEMSRTEKELNLSHLLVRYLEGVRARVWVDDVVTQVDIPCPHLLKILAVDPWIHLEAQVAETDLEKLEAEDGGTDVRKEAANGQNLGVEMRDDGKEEEVEGVVGAAEAVIGPPLLNEGDGGEPPRVAMSLARMEFDDLFWTCLSSIFSSSCRATLPFSDLVADARLQRLVHSFLPCLLPLLAVESGIAGSGSVEAANGNVIKGEEDLGSASAKNSSADVAVKILERLFTEEEYVTLVPSMVEDRGLECSLNPPPMTALHFPLFPPNSASITMTN